jgi:hypothetical protein
MFAADDMVNLVRETGVLFVDEAVFATMPRALSHFAPERLADVSGH